MQVQLQVCQQALRARRLPNFLFFPHQLPVHWTASDLLQQEPCLPPPPVLLPAQRCLQVQS
jgi:hypothetical protein